MAYLQNLELHNVCILKISLILGWHKYLSKKKFDRLGYETEIFGLLLTDKW